MFAHRSVGVFDIETDGLEPTLIHCITVKNKETNKSYHYGPDKIEEAINYLGSFTVLSGHNIIGYDLPAIKKLYGVDLWKECKIRDTLVMSHMSVNQRPKHDLGSIGVELGREKPKHEDWSEYTPEMAHRNMEDVEINSEFYDVICEELKDYSEESIEMEMQASYVLSQMKENGFPTDRELVFDLHETMWNRRKYIENRFENFPKIPINKGIRKGTREDGYEFSAVEWTDFNPGSNAHVLRLLHDQWNPTEKSPKGQWKLSEKNLETIKDTAPEELHLIKEYKMLVSRTAWLKSVVEASDDKGYVHGSMFSTAASTDRCTHFNPNMANIAGKNSPYGKECRSLFAAPEGYCIVGIDAQGIQLRVLAHLMNDKDYIDAICNGDIHLTNLDALGIGRGEWSDEHGWSNRDKAKTFIYAFLLGASVSKLALICGVSNGTALKNKFLTSLPALAKLLERVQKVGEQHKRIKLIDGRVIKPFPDYCRLTPLLQGNEAIFMKNCLIKTHQFIEDNNLDAWIAAFVHDEFQIVCREDQSVFLGEACEAIFLKTGEELGFRIPMPGEAKYGSSWYETH